MSDATTAAAAATTTATTTTAATTAAAATAPAWHGIAETDTAGLAYVANKGWKGVGDVIKSYQGAEKVIGRDPSTLISIPKADDPVGFRAVMTSLGLPETADKYEFAKVPDGLKQDDGYVAWARDTFHKLGLPASTVKALTTEHNNYVKGVLDKQASDYNVTVEAGKKELLAKWGGGHERMMNAAKTAAKALGFDEKMIDAIERERGYVGTWEFMANLGQKLGEPGFVDGKGGTGFSNATMTPDEAKAKWDQVKNDPVWQKAAGDATHPDHAKAVKQQADLFAIMYPARK